MPRGGWATTTFAPLARFGARLLIERCHAPRVGLAYRAFVRVSCRRNSGAVRD